MIYRPGGGSGGRGMVDDGVVDENPLGGGGKTLINFASIWPELFGSPMTTI